MVDLLARQAESVVRAGISLLILLTFWQGTPPTIFNGHYTADNGLASNTVYSVTQDNDGYIWIGTDNGVSRFDGRSFTTFTIEDGLTDNEVLKVHADSRGRVWFLTYNGVPGFYEDGVFHNPQNHAALSQVESTSHFTSFCETEDGSVWLGSVNGVLHRISPQGEVSQTVLPKGQRVFQLWSQHNRVYAGVRPLGIYDIIRKELTPLSIPAPPEGTCRWRMDDGYSYIGIQNSLYIIDPKQRLVKMQELPAGEKIQSISSGAEEHEIAIGTSNGLRYMDKGSHELSALILEGRSISSTCTDTEGGYWITTAGQGIFHAQSRGMKHFTSEHLEAGQVYSICTLGDSVWFGMKNGRVGIIQGEEVVENTFIPDDRGQRQQAPVKEVIDFNGHPLFLVDKKVFDQNGRPGFDPKRNWTTSLNTIYRSNDHSYWVGSNIGISDVVPHTTSAAKNSPQQILRSQFPVRTICALGNKRFLCGTSTGVFKADFVRGSIDPVLPELESMQISGILALGDDLVLIATNGWGVFLFDSDRLVKSWNAQEGPYPSDVQRLIKGPNGSIWMTDRSGLYRIKNPNANYADWQWQYLNESSGLLSDAIHDVDFFEDKIYIASAKGISIVDTNHLVLNRAPPRLIRVSRINGMSAKAGPNQGATFQLEVVSLADQNLHYRFSLDDGPWKETAESTLNLSDLEAGMHVLRASVRSNVSDWSDEQSLSFRIDADAGGLFAWIAGIAGFSVLALAMGWFVIRSKNRRKNEPTTPIGETVQRDALPPNLPPLIVKSSGEVIKVPKHEILWIKAEANYSAIVTEQAKHLILTPLKSIEQQLTDAPDFMRVHRSYIVNMQRVTSASPSEVTIGNTVIPIGPTYRITYHSFYETFAGQD